VTDQSDANAFLMGGGARSFKFTNVGDRVWGTVMSSEKRQQTEFGTGALKTWDDGSPQWQVVVTLLTELQEDDDDDSLRAIYIKGGMQRAVRAALVKAKVPGIEDGGRLLVQYTGLGEKKGQLSAPKLYFAKYEPPTNITELPDQPGELEEAAGMISDDYLPF
jgi:hypothetical protein